MKYLFLCAALVFSSAIFAGEKHIGCLTPYVWNMGKPESVEKEVCKCADGQECICKDGECFCVDCPKHQEVVSSEDKATTYNRASNRSAVVYLSEDNKLRASLVEDGKVVKYLHSSAFSMDRVRTWLDGSEMKSTTVKSTPVVEPVRIYHQNPVQYRNHSGQYRVQCGPNGCRLVR